MDILDKYGLDNPLKEIGIDNIYDIDGLRKKCSSLIVNIKDALLEKNKHTLIILNEKLATLEDEKSKASQELAFEYDKKIDKVKKDISGIKIQREKWYDELDVTSSEVYSTEDVSLIIYRIIKLSSSYAFLVERDKDDPEFKHFQSVVKDLSMSLKTPEQVKEFLVKKIFSISYVDVENRDLSRYKYTGAGKNKQGFPDYIYVAKPTEEPKKLIDLLNEMGERIQVYKIGKYAFGQYAISEDHYAYKSGEYTILTVLRQNKEGELKTYNGVIDNSSNDILKHPNFYGLVVFSDFVMENAEKNNFGYIGSVYLDENGQRRLGFNTNIEDRDLVTSLSYAQNNEGRFFNLPKCKTIQDFYNIMNQKVKEISDIERPLGPNFDDDEGRR